MDLRSNRNKLRISQSRLASLAGVSRFKICLYELGEGNLTPQELRLIRKVLQIEAERLRNLAINFESEPTAATAESTVGV
jgi:predicted transcriptional regulator